MCAYITKSFIAGMAILLMGMAFLEGNHYEAGIFHLKGRRSEWIWPADGIISDTFGTRQGRHKGIDIAGRMNSPIFAVDDGVVEKSYFSNSYGNVIFIRHPSNYVAVYAHLSTRMAEEGQSVRKGQIIGKMGKSGQATGVHLHFEIHHFEWTYDKKFALDPAGVLGAKKLGEIVQAGAPAHEDNALEASSRFHDQQENQINRQTSEKKLDGNIYVVQQGDTLSAISRKKALTVDELKKRNRLSSDIIKPGQVLIIDK